MTLLDDLGKGHRPSRLVTFFLPSFLPFFFFFETRGPRSLHLETTESIERNLGHGPYRFLGSFPSSVEKKTPGQRAALRDVPQDGHRGRERGREDVSNELTYPDVIRDYSG